MNEARSEAKNYKQLTINLVKENKIHAAVGSILFLALIFSLTARFGSIFVTKFTTGISNLSHSFKSSSDTPLFSVNEIKDSLNGTEIDYISPGITNSVKPENNLGVVAENGQISAIMTKQVTYKQNKYVIKRGESLADVAEQVYGDKNAWVRIANANGIKDPDHIEVGMVLIIPR